MIPDQAIKELTRVNMPATTYLLENVNIDESKRQQKRDSRHTISDDDPVTDWIPEIPFWNVSLNNSHSLPISVKCSNIQIVVSIMLKGMNR